MDIKIDDVNNKLNYNEHANMSESNIIRNRAQITRHQKNKGFLFKQQQKNTFFISLVNNVFYLRRFKLKKTNSRKVNISLVHFFFFFL